MSGFDAPLGRASLVAPLKSMPPVDVIPVKPEATPAEEISQDEELIEIASPPSPKFTTPLKFAVLLEVRVSVVRSLSCCLLRYLLLL